MTEGSWARRIRDGARLLAADRLLRLLAAVQLLAALSAGATSALLVVLADIACAPGLAGSGCCWVRLAPALRLARWCRPS